MLTCCLKTFKHTLKTFLIVLKRCFLDMVQISFPKNMLFSHAYRQNTNAAGRVRGGILEEEHLLQPIEEMNEQKHD